MNLPNAFTSVKFKKIRTNGFTLIELLVVITIIVVLLALLTPALDKAVYQAQLASCGAQLKGVAGGANVYAADYKRSYPARTAMVAGNRQPSVIARGGARRPPGDPQLHGPQEPHRPVNRTLSHRTVRGAGRWQRLFQLRAVVRVRV